MKELPVGFVPLPSEIIEGLRKKGIERLTPPQSEALNKGVLKGKNVIVSAPTASGKTLIAELALLKAWLSGLKGIYATPLKTLASEKADEFKYWGFLGLNVGLTTGDFDEPGEELGQYDVIVATYERLDSIYRLKPSWLRDVGVVVIDEFHMVGDQDRGPIVELLAVKSTLMNAQLVGLSATIGNPQELSSWIDAELVVSDWRPVDLIEGYYLRSSRKIYFNDGREEKVKSQLPLHIAKETFEGGYQSLIFVHSRRRAETLARKLAKEVGNSTSGSLEAAEKIKGSEAPNIEKEDLTRLLRDSIAYHHAGLSHASRKVVEEAFRKGLIRVIVATPTLAAGINLPARRVLVYTRRYSYGYMAPISVAEYKQMAGRAGRPQFDPYGEAIVADAPNREYALKYIQGKPESVKSSLMNEKAMRIHTLALISSRDANSINELMNILGRTLAFKQLGISVWEDAVNYIVNKLKNMEMVEVEKRNLRPTSLGLLTSKLYIDPLTSLMILQALEDIDDAQPLYYFVTIAMTPDFSKVRITRFKELEEEAAIALENELVPPPLPEVSYYEWLRAYKVGRILNAWIDEVQEDLILERYAIGAGDLRNIVETAEWLTYAASRIAGIKGLRTHTLNLGKLSLRVKHGIKEELIDLARIRGVGRVRARVLYLRGLRTVKDVAVADPRILASFPGFGVKVAEAIVNEAKKMIAGKA